MGSPLRTISILLVESNGDRRSRIREMLRASAHKTTMHSLGSKEEALAYLERESTCAILALGSTLTEGTEDLVKFFRTERPLHCPPLLAIPTSTSPGALAVFMEMRVGAVLLEPISVAGAHSALTRIVESEDFKAHQDFINRSVYQVLIACALPLIERKAEALINEAAITLVEARELKGSADRLEPLREHIDAATVEYVLTEFTKEAKPFAARKAKRAPKRMRKKEQAVAAVLKLLEQRKISEEKFTQMMNVDKERLVGFLRGTEGIDPRLAQELSRVLGRDPKYWLSFESAPPP